MKNLIFLFCFVLLAACGKDKHIDPANESMIFQGTGNLPDGTKMDCELFNEMYFSEELEFKSMVFHHNGTVKFNNNGTCENTFNDGDKFLSWSYFTVNQIETCNVINVVVKDSETGNITNSIFSFSQYFEDRARAVRVDNGDIYYFYPL